VYSRGVQGAVVRVFVGVQGTVVRVFVGCTGGGCSCIFGGVQGRSFVHL